jgi:hypothetical protein
MLNRARRWRALLASSVAVGALAFAAVGPAAAVRFGSPDGNAHPYVGLMVAQDADGVPLWRCTGTLLSATVFLTAGHCVESPAAHIEIWFDPGPVPLGAGYPASGSNPCDGVTGYPCTGDVGGTPHKHPLWDPVLWWTHDAGIVTLDNPFPMAQYGLLPELNQFDSLHNGDGTWFTAVGYGLQKAFPDAASWKDEAVRIRLVAHPRLIQANDRYVGDIDLIVSDNGNTGGTCFGDSGGPNFLRDTRVIAGVNSFVKNNTCGGQSGVYRIDQPDDLPWIMSFLQ